MNSPTMPHAPKNDTPPPPKHRALHKRMADDGVVCRFRGSCLHLANCLRVTVGIEEENKKFLSKLREHLK